MTIGEVGDIPIGGILTLVTMEVAGNGAIQDYTDTEDMVVDMVVDMVADMVADMVDMVADMVDMVDMVVVFTKAKSLTVANLLIQKSQKGVDVILEQVTMVDITSLIMDLVTMITTTPFKDLGRLVTITLEMIGQIGITTTTISSISHIWNISLTTVITVVMDVPVYLSQLIVSLNSTHLFILKPLMVLVAD